MVQLPLVGESLRLGQSVLYILAQIQIQVTTVTSQPGDTIREGNLGPTFCSRRPWITQGLPATWKVVLLVSLFKS